MTDVPRRRWGLWIPWTIFAILAAAWTGYWFILSTQAQSAVNKWAAERRAAGADVGYENVFATGYPLRLTLTYAKPHYQSARGWAVTAPELKLHINPSDLSLYIVEPRGPIVWTRGDVAETYQPHTAAISIRMKDGKLQRVSVEAEEMDYTRGDAAPAHLKSIVAHVRPDPRAVLDAQVSVDIDSLTLAKEQPGLEGLGREIKTAHARVVVEKGFGVISPSPDRLAAWRDAGGAARVEGLALDWGPAKMTATGRFVLDAEKRAAGKLDMKLADPGAALGALAQSPGLSPQMAQVMQRVADAAAAKGETLDLPLVIEDGVMSIGMLPIQTVEPIR